MIKLLVGEVMQKLIAREPIEVVIVRKNNKNIYLRFKEDGKLYATCNRLVTEKAISKLIDDNLPKITKMYQEIKKQTTQELYFNYLGKKYTICYLPDTKTFFDNDIIYSDNEKNLNKFYDQEVVRIFTSEVNRIKPYFENIPDFKLKFRKMKTRWGVCNRGNNTVTLNTELLKKDIDLLDYVIIHELCHFYEANHSPKFWNYVSKFYPKYKEARKRLRSN